MAIILPQDHPAFSRLQSANVAVRPLAANLDEKAQSNIVKLGFVNLMPREYLEETVDLLLTRFANGDRDIQPIFISPEHKADKGISWAAAKDDVDTVLITGYAASNLPFEELCFWPELQTIIRDCDRERKPLLAVCAGAMAVAYETYNIAKEQAPHKLLGNYDYKTPDGKSIFLATSRNNTLNRYDLLAALEEHKLTIALETTDTPRPEPGIIIDRSRNWVLALAHLEYAYTTCNTYPDFEGQDLHILDYQYRRDHNTDSPKYDPALAARVLPPANLELSAAQVHAREAYAEQLMNGWVLRSLDLKNQKRPQASTSYGRPAAGLRL
ncbi:MAG: homoserine O-succinyltransferase [Micavibrio sp.]